MKIQAKIISLLLLFPILTGATIAQQKNNAGLDRAQTLMTEVKKSSFPELNNTKVEVQFFSSQSDYFVTGIRFVRFFSGQRMAFVIKVNPQVFTQAAPEAGLRAILAHELGHVLWLQQQPRLKLLRLARMASKKYTAQFERRTDLIAITRGYGEGLATYRRWLYQHIPPQKLAGKKRNYFSPEEIAALQVELKKHPKKMAMWLKNPPLNLAQMAAGHDE